MNTRRFAPKAILKTAAVQTLIVMFANISLPALAQAGPSDNPRARWMAVKIDSCFSAHPDDASALDSCLTYKDNNLSMFAKHQVNACFENFIGSSVNMTLDARRACVRKAVFALTFKDKATAVAELGAKVVGLAAILGASAALLSAMIGPVGLPGTLKGVGDESAGPDAQNDSDRGAVKNVDLPSDAPAPGPSPASSPSLKSAA